MTGRRTLQGELSVNKRAVLYDGGEDAPNVLLTRFDDKRVPQVEVALTERGDGTGSAGFG